MKTVYEKVGCMQQITHPCILHFLVANVLDHYYASAIWKVIATVSHEKFEIKRVFKYAVV